MGTVHRLSTIAKQREDSYEGYVTPEHIHEFIEPCQTRLVTFKSRKSMQSYRRMLYDINKQGDFRYRTMRDEASMWGLIVWRMK